MLMRPDPAYGGSVQVAWRRPDDGAKLTAMEEIRRPSDGELCGFVELGDGCWRALSVFGAELGAHEQKVDAISQVQDDLSLIHISEPTRPY